MPYKDPDKQRAFQRERCRRLRKEWLDAHGPCAKCGSRKDPQVDHIDPETKVAHNVWSWTPKRRDAELAKCQVLCIDCHKEKTKAERWRPITHGHESAYTRRGCRCPACTEAHRLARAKYRKKQRRSVTPMPEKFR